MFRIFLKLFLVLFILCQGAEAFGFSRMRYAFPIAIETYVTFDSDKKFAIPKAINLNTADLNHLMLIPSMTTNTAIKIIRCRPFRDVNDLKRLETEGISYQQVAMLIDTYQNSSRPFILWQEGGQETLRQ